MFLGVCPLLGRSAVIRRFCVSPLVMNRLAGEKSPYILQHKDNPVNWYPWGEEAFGRARALNVPIFLSVGYSTCHWCHVMEKESFENHDVAKILNDNFVAIKVDREERPDVDKLYMGFILAVTGGHGGWPMSVFLTPSLAPITGGTYFPPEDGVFGQMGFKTVLRFIADKWSKDADSIKASSLEVMQALNSSSKTRPGEAPSPEVASRAIYQKLESTFDEEKGGFGDAPKFPKAVDLSFLLRFAITNPTTIEGKKSLKMLKATLHAIYHGGIHDHVGKGFHRYSVDRGWHVPHFEKMAYDQGQLLSVFSDVALLTGDSIAAAAARDIVEYVEESLSHRDGGFWSAEDADSFEKEGDAKKREGAFCVWTKKEMEETLAGVEFDGKALSDIACPYFGVLEEGNSPPYTDPHGELKGRNVLIMNSTHEEMSEILGMESGRLKEAIDKAKELLRDRRSHRPRPHLDTKMVTAWQGLLISGFARAAIALKDPFLSLRAKRAVDFVRSRLVDEHGDLIRAVYTAEDGDVDRGSPIAAFSDDYAFLIRGLLDLYEATMDESLVKWAHELQKKCDEKFWEGEKGYFISESSLGGGEGVKTIEEQDGAEPCASSVAMNNVIRLAELLDDKEYRKQGDRIVSFFASRLQKYPFIAPSMVEGHARNEEGETQVVIVAEDAAPFFSVLHSFLIPNLSVVKIRPSTVDSSWLVQQAPHLRQYLIAKSPTVFVCQGRACGLPVHTAEELKQRLEEVTSVHELLSTGSA